jgi:hypothetical protein
MDPGERTMSILTLEGIVDHGQIRLAAHVRLPENAKVYVLVPDVQIEATARIESPRLLHPEQAADFTMEISETNAGV